MAKKYVLFSPIGMSDPARNGHDGPMLHILRQYHPEEAVLFMTKEVTEIHRQDDRFRVSAGMVSPTTRCVVSEHPEIAGAHTFEVYDKLFRSELTQLHRRYPEHTLLVNISSGTPQMEASLYMLSATLPFSVVPVQVASPMGERHNYNNDFKLEDMPQIQQTETEKGRKNRNSEITLVNLPAALLGGSISELLDSYDYSAVRTLLASAPELFPAEARAFAEAAYQRLLMNTEEAQQRVKAYESKVGFYFELSGGDFRACYEYLLMLDTLLSRKMYGDYVRALSPALSELMQLSLRKLCGVDIADLSVAEGGVKKLSAQKIWEHSADLSRYLDERFGANGLRDKTPVAANNLLYIMEFCKAEEQLLREFTTLRKFEGAVRNLAAHEITVITQEHIRQIAEGVTPEEVQRLLQNRFAALYPKKTFCWNGYQRMNDHIRQLIGVKEAEK